MNNAWLQTKKTIIEPRVIGYFQQFCNKAKVLGKDLDKETVEIDGILFSLYTSNFKLVLEDTGHTRDTWGGTIECWSNVGRPDLPQNW